MFLVCMGRWSKLAVYRTVGVWLVDTFSFNEQLVLFSLTVKDC
jgi:hypothetical protein